MAPIQNFYFPPLDQCLSGEHQLLSWHSAAQAVTDPSFSYQNDFINGFFSDDSVRNILSRPLKPFDNPSSATKSSFETRTAPSQVTRDENGGYNIDEIKKDTTWLSEKVRVDEITALRIVVLEWQSRPVELLQSDVSQPADELGLTSSTGTFLPNGSTLNAPISNGSDRSLLESRRRQRILKLWIEEKASVVRIVEILVGAALDRKYRKARRLLVTQKERSDSPTETLGDELLVKQEHQGARFQLACIDATNNILSQLANGSGWFNDDSLDVEEAWGKAALLEIIYLQKLMLLHLFASTELMEASTAVRWFKTMDEYGFVASWQPPFESQLPLLNVMHITIALISLVILQLSSAVSFLHEPNDPDSVSNSASSHLLKDPVAFNDIHGILSKVAMIGPSPATLAVFAWFIIHYNIRHVREVYRPILEAAEQDGEKSEAEREARKLRPHADRLDNISLADDEMELLANCAVGAGRAHEVMADLASKLVSIFGATIDQNFQQCARLRLLELITSSLEITRYDLPVINATLAVLSSQQDFWSFVDTSKGDVLDPVCSLFLDDHDVLRPLLFDVAQLRFPYEISPFLRFCRALAVNIADDSDQHELLVLLSALPYFVQKLPSSFGAHELSREETEHNYIRLTAELPIFQGVRQGGRTIAGKGTGIALTLAQDFGVMCVPAETEGLNNGEMLVTWNFPFNAVAYLTTLLSTAIRNSEVFDFATQASVTLDTAAEIVHLFNTILAAGLKTPSDDIQEVQAVKLVLETAGESEAPLIRIVLELFEQELQSQRDNPNSEGFELLIACTQCLYLITKIFPDKIWPFLSRSKFLDSEGLAAIVAGTEMVLGRYEFLRASIRLYNALIDDAVTNAVKRRIARSNSDTSKALARFGDTIPGRGSPEKIMSKTLLAFTRTFTNAIETMDGWRFAHLEERLILNAEILSAFNSVLLHSYGYSDIRQLDHKLTAALADSADYLYQMFSSPSANKLSIVPILAIMSSSASRTGTSLLFVSHEALWTRQTISAIQFADLILGVNSIIDHELTGFVAQLFKAVPVLTRLYATSDRYKSVICTLLTTMINSAVENDKEPPSLLASMGEDKAKAFMSLLTRLGKPLDGMETEVAIWNLVSAIVSGRQQWLATLLLTGRTPREEVKARSQKSNPSSPNSSRSLLAYALDELCYIADLKPERSIAMLQFLMLSQNHWPWAMTPLRSHPRFLVEIQKFAGDLRPEDVQGSSERTILTAERYRMASSIAEILAMYLHQVRQLGPADNVVKDLIPRLSFLRNFAITAPAENGSSQQFNIPTYNTNLHSNLEKNFASKYPGVRLGDFKRVLNSERANPRQYYYDTGYAGLLLQFSPSWTGRKNDGYAADFLRANINLYLVQTQVDVLKGWQMLAAELSSFLKSDPRVSPLLVKVIHDCLDANIHNNLPQTPLFERLNQSRVEFAFVMLQKLVQGKAHGDNVKSILGKVWDAIRASGHDFEMAFTGDGTEYYRSLLKLLFLALHFHLTTPPLTSPTTKTNSEAPRSNVLQTESILLEILSKVVAAGFRSLARTLHESPSTPTIPNDIILLTALLQSILGVPAMKLLHSQIALQFASNNTIRYAISLFSWSDQLANATNKDPVYAELSILFLLELSTVPAIAENMAVEGVLAGISTASVTSYFRREAGVGPLEPQGRLHAVWAKGVLPLCLNLLGAVRSPIAPEVSAFLNQFPGQLSRSAAIFGTMNVPPSEIARYQVTLSMAAELHSLALIGTILEQLRKESPNGSEINNLHFDLTVMKEDLEGWVRGRRSLMDRLVPTNDREIKLASVKANATSAVDNELEEKLLVECKMAVDCANYDAK